MLGSFFKLLTASVIVKSGSLFGQGARHRPGHPGFFCPENVEACGCLGRTGRSCWPRSRSTSRSRRRPVAFLVGLSASVFVWNRGKGPHEGADQGHSDISLMCAPGRAFWLAGSTNTKNRTGWHRLRGRAKGESPMGKWRHSLLLVSCLCSSLEMSGQVRSQVVSSCRASWMPKATSGLRVVAVPVQGPEAVLARRWLRRPWTRPISWPM